MDAREFLRNRIARGGPYTTVRVGDLLPLKNEILASRRRNVQQLGKQLGHPLGTQLTIFTATLRRLVDEPDWMPAPPPVPPESAAPPASELETIAPIDETAEPLEASDLPPDLVVEAEPGEQPETIDPADETAGQ